MKNGITKSTILLFLVLAAEPVFGQASGNGSSIFTTGLIAVAILLVLGVIVLVGDNLLALEARRVGVDGKKTNLSVFPAWNEIFRPKKADYVADKEVTMLKRGHDILLKGVPAAEQIEDVTATRYALQPKNFRGLAPIPKLLVEEGQTVKVGDPLFFDKSMPDVKFGAPVSGEVIEIRRGAKRSIEEIIILADKEMQYRELKPVDPEAASREELVNFLKESGAWMIFRQRPYDVVADPEEEPANIFVSTFDTAPLAPNNDLLLDGREAEFQKGIDVLNHLTSGSVHLGLNAGADKAPANAFTEAQNAQLHWFHGKHPAGNVGVHIHHVDPVTPSTKVWTLGVQDVISLGHIFLHGTFDNRRIVSVGGSEVENPKYIRTYLGANMGELLQGNLQSEHVRMISGDVLSGQKKSEDQFLDFYDDQITVIKEGDYFELFGWLLPLAPRPSVSRTFPNFLFPSLRFEGDTNTHGEKRAFVVTGQYEKVLPMDIYVQHVMKSIIIQDFEKMEGLGALELIEEDVALCEFVCTSKQPLQSILRDGLDYMREQG